MVRDLGRHVDNVVHFELVDSTHAVALRLIDQVDSEGLQLRPTVVIAESQSQGVGRGRRRWVSPTGGLYLSWISAGLDDDQISRLPMLAASSALLAVTAMGVTGAAVKWPNDILVEGRKLAGILVHARRGDVNCCTVGLGVNIEPVAEPIEDAIQPPTSLAELIGREQAAEGKIGVASTFLAALTQALVEPESALERWRSQLIHRIGDPISVRLASGAVSSGSFAGVTDEGYLRLLDDSGGEVILTGGDVTERGGPGTDPEARNP
jgi:BirA family biotin operon repressor/biotin-[acetyl-CoA-carboxylase] ligase